MSGIATTTASTTAAEATLASLDVSEWKKNPDKFRYMMDKSHSMLRLLHEHGLNDSVRVRAVRSSSHGLYISFQAPDLSEGVPDIWSLNIFEDRRETWRCNGFTIYMADKQYYGKQFINMIKTRQHYHNLEIARKQAIHDVSRVSAAWRAKKTSW